MSELEDDLARVAALRGHDPAAYATPQAQDTHAWRLARDTIQNPNAMRHLFVGSPDMVDRELAVTDTLPPMARAFVKDAPIYVNAIAVANVLEAAHYRLGPALEACHCAMLAMVNELDRRHYPGRASGDHRP